MATFHKLRERKGYEVKRGDTTIGWFYRYYERAYRDPKYVGYFPGDFFWCFEPEDTDAPGYFQGVSFKEGQQRIEKEYPE
jgi:hypothetical protein